MNDATRRAIQQIDRAFYRDHASDFAAKRTTPWPGWRRVLSSADDRLGRRPTILDLGCGHGRFADFLATEIEREHAVIGVDSSAPLLDLARQTDPAHQVRRWLEGELVEADCWSKIDEALPAQGADLVVAFGLLHHIPGVAERRRILERCRERLAPGGLLAVSFWQFSDVPRIRDRLLPWSAFAPSGEGAPEIDPLDLEPGDHLLPWGELDDPRADRLRYCHDTRPEAADELSRDAGLEPIERFFADGRSERTNYYLLLRSQAPE